MQWLYLMSPILILAAFGVGVSVGLSVEPLCGDPLPCPWGMLEVILLWYGMGASGLVAIGASVLWPASARLWSGVLLATWLLGFAGFRVVRALVAR